MPPDVLEHLKVQIEFHEARLRELRESYEVCVGEARLSEIARQTVFMWNEPKGRAGCAGERR